MANNPRAVDNLKPFKKKDPRINKAGRPKGFTQLRELAQEIAHEVATSKSGDVIVNGHKVTVVEAILRQWASNPKMQEAFMAYAFGKVPQALEHTGADGDVIRVTLKHDD